MRMPKADLTKPRIARRAGRLGVLGLAVALSVCGCARTAQKGWQGYLEGDFVYVSSPLAGRLERLAVAKGSRASAGATLFELEHAAEAAALRQAEQELLAAKAQLEDLKKGSRPEEIAALVARLGSAKAEAELSRLDLERQEALFKSGAISQSDYDHARLTHAANLHAVAQNTAQLETSRLGGRTDAVAAAAAAARAAGDAEAHARWSVDQKAQPAPCDALVYDTLYREGEFVPAGSPVVCLLPPANLKVRFFVAEPDYGSLKAGDTVTVSIDGLPSPLGATVSYMSPQPEYTPPVLYNRDNRAKLVYMVEAVFARGAAADLHPGQPVDVHAPGR